MVSWGKSPGVKNNLKAKLFFLLTITRLVRFIIAFLFNSMIAKLPKARIKQAKKLNKKKVAV